MPNETDPIELIRAYGEMFDEPLLLLIDLGAIYSLTDTEATLNTKTIALQTALITPTPHNDTDKIMLTRIQKHQHFNRTCKT